MEIKFWDKEKQEYDNERYYKIDSDLQVFGFDRFNMEFNDKAIEPHFYLNGERVA